jgi:hypothetical protein
MKAVMDFGVPLRRVKFLNRRVLSVSQKGLCYLELARL